MSAIEGLEAIQAKIKRLDAYAKERLDAAIEIGAKQMQDDMVRYAPVRTGKLRSLLGSGEALRIVQKRGATQASVGFITPAMKKAGFMYFFVETGTKGRAAGTTRRAGKDKRGRYRFQRVKRNIPAHRAQPFFRPALANLLRNMPKLRKEAWAKAAADAILKG